MRSTLLRKATRQTVAVAFLVTPFILAQGLYEGRWWAISITASAYGAATFALVQTYRQVRHEQHQ